MYQKIITELKSMAEPEFSSWLRPFLNLKNDDSEILLGVRVPKLRKLAKQYKDISEGILLDLLHSNYHEARALALFIMIYKVKSEPEKMCRIYIENLKYINNWDLIDYTCPHIVAPYAGLETLKLLADSDYMWANRTAMVSMIYFIKRGDFTLTLEFAEKFMNHPHHLMHKAAGWMLREVGKQDENILKQFLETHSNKMPSVMRNYAMERLRKKKN